MPLKRETATPGVGTRGSGKMEKLGGASFSDKYSGQSFSAMPSSERSGSMARVIARGDRLFAVGYFAERAG